MEGTSNQPAPSRESILTLREITEDNWRAVARLSPKPGQVGNLASNVWSIAGAHYDPATWLRAIYADDTLVGMLMMGIEIATDDYYICRFMIDGRYQNLSYGKRGVELAMDYIRQHYPAAKRLWLTSTPPEGEVNEDDPSRL